MAEGVPRCPARDRLESLFRLEAEPALLRSSCRKGESSALVARACVRGASDEKEPGSFRRALSGALLSRLENQEAARAAHADKSDEAGEDEEDGGAEDHRVRGEQVVGDGS